MKIEVLPCTDQYLPDVKRLYLSAFPKDERVPYFFLMRQLNKGRAVLLAATDENMRFAGFVYMLCLNDMLYVFYLAVEDSFRGQGVGTAILEHLKENYPKHRIFLSREQLDETADNYKQRTARRAFYQKCGFRDMGQCVQEGKMVYSVMGIGGKVSPQEYDELVTNWSGKLIKHLFKLSLYESEDAR